MKAREFYELQTHDSTCVVGIMDKDEIINLMDAFFDAEVDKMVSERLREELIAYDKWMSSHKWGIRELLSPETTVNEYLKTREK